MSARTVFDIAIRLLECQSCGAPIMAPSGGGQVSCEFCRAVNAVSVRRADAPSAPSSMTADVARLARLKSQLDNPIGGHVYSLDRPPLGWDASPSALRLESEWQRAKLSPNATPEEQRTLFWIAMKLADVRRGRGEKRAARATLETALDRLIDAGHRHLVRCRLASEALSEHDLAAAEGWLRECDPAPEVLELDSAYRTALAWLRTMQGDLRATLAIVGTRDGDVPFEESAHGAMARLRVHALETLGHSREADEELEQLASREGEDATLAELASERLAPHAAARMQAARAAAQREEDERALRQAVHRLASTHRPAAGLLDGLTAVPILALVLMIPVTVSRCTADFDPLLGVPGYVLCPRACDGCEGPIRTITVWHETGPGEWSTNGAQYFCPSPENGIASMSDAALESNVYQLSQWELSYAPHGATFLMLFVLCIPFGAYRGLARYRVRSREREQLFEEVRAAAAKLGVPPPRPPPRPLATRLLYELAFVASSIAVALLFIAADAA